MNVILPEKQKILNKRNITYLTIIIVCIVAIAIAVYQFYTEEKLGVIIGITKDENEGIEELRQNFDKLFTNKLQVKQKELTNDIKKSVTDKEYVYTEYEKDEEVTDNYNLHVKIPYINIEGNVAEEFNKEIKKTFEEPSEYILQTEKRNIIYTVNYMATIDNDILSVAILSTFKENDNVQRTISKTYNYNLKSKEKVTLEDFINMKNLDKKTLENEIKKVIKNAQEQTEQLTQLGYDIFSRNITDDMYKVENTENYFLYDDHLYLIYAYGNSNNTSEMDIVII